MRTAASQTSKTRMDEVLGCQSLSELLRALFFSGLENHGNSLGIQND